MNKVFNSFLILLFTYCLFSENIIADSNLLDGEITAGKLIEYNQIDLIKLKHEVYARKGYSFKSKWLEEYFLNLSWYKPDKDFKYSSLIKNDWIKIKNIDDALYEKEKNVSRKMKEKKNFQIKYYLKDYERQEYPKEIKTAITNFMYKTIDGNVITVGYWFPYFYKTNFQNEISVKKLRSLLNPDGFSYYICMYDGERLVKILPIIESPGLYDEPVHYLDKLGNVVFVEGNNPGAMGGYRWFFYYENEKVVSISLTRWNTDENVPDAKIERLFFFR